MEARDLHAVRDQLLKTPNSNTTGRLPAVALLHVRMKVRLTVTVCPCQAPVDTVGTIRHIELDAADRGRWQREPGGELLVLHHLPIVLMQIADDAADDAKGAEVARVRA